jgi:hypothetical protein
VSIGPAASGIVVPALLTWLRYVVPLTLLSAVALFPVIAAAAVTRTPVDAAGASATLTRGWLLLAIAWPCQLVLIGGASAAAGGQPSQLRALGAGLVQLVRAILPCIAAMGAIVIGSLALIVPGILLFVLLAPTGASRQRGIRAALADTLTVTRKRLLVATLAIAAMLAIDLAIGVVSFRTFAGVMPRHPSPAQLAAARSFVRAVALALVAVSPLPATVLAMLHRGAEPDRRT